MKRLLGAAAAAIALLCAGSASATTTIYEYSDSELFPGGGDYATVGPVFFTKDGGSTFTFTVEYGGLEFNTNRWSGINLLFDGYAYYWDSTMPPAGGIDGNDTGTKQVDCGIFDSCTQALPGLLTSTFAWPETRGSHETCAPPNNNCLVEYHKLYALTMLRFNRAEGASDAWMRVTFTNTPAGVPEPATWAMMIIGFGLAGVSLRRPVSRAYGRP